MYVCVTCESLATEQCGRENWIPWNWNYIPTVVSQPVGSGNQTPATKDFDFHTVLSVPV